MTKIKPLLQDESQARHIIVRGGNNELRDLGSWTQEGANLKFFGYVYKGGKKHEFLINGGSSLGPWVSFLRLLVGPLSRFDQFWLIRRTRSKFFGRDIE